MLLSNISFNTRRFLSAQTSPDHRRRDRSVFNATAATGRGSSSFIFVIVKCGAEMTSLDNDPKRNGQEIGKGNDSSDVVQT
jgi:hypothetical protein